MGDAIRVRAPPSLRRWADEHGYAPELVARWDAFYGDVVSLVNSMAQPPARYLRLNALRADPRTTLQRLRAKGFELSPTPLAEAWRIDDEPFAAGATDEYLQGHYHLQDLSAQLAVLALEPAPGERVADLAAAPGGKTIQTAQAMQNTGVLHAFDIEPGRVRALRSNLARCGVSNAAVHHRDARDAARLAGRCDRVLLDAPCTGEGVIQRDPTRRQGHLGEYEQCAADQKDLVDAAVSALRPGGILVYSTCTLAPEENELQVQEALDRHPLRLEELPAALRGLRLADAPLTPGLVEVAGRRLDDALARAAHTLPHIHGCLGFFVARFRKEDDA